MRYRWIILLLGVAAGGATPLSAQSSLPSSFAGWTAGPSHEYLKADAIEGLAGSDGALLREFGVLDAERQGYSRRSEALEVTLYRLRDATGAYGAFTFRRSDEMLPAGWAKFAALSPKHAVATVGNILVEVTGNHLDRSADDLKNLIGYVSARAETTPYPTLTSYLPRAGRVSNSERYLIGPVALNRLLPLDSGDWLGFADGAEAELARYRLKGQEATLLVAAYPTPQLAARKLEELSRWWPFHRAHQDKQRAFLARRSSSLVAVVAESSSPALANSLLQQIHYQTDVTWNEPRHKLTDPSMPTIIVGTILGTGLILLFALLAGIGFGGLRLVVKYFFPGKVFDRPGRLEILQLGLSSKPIQAKDFY